MHPHRAASSRSAPGFDRWIESRCSQYYEQDDLRGSRSIPPGVYFRMLLVGYFEDISSQRGIAWRCADSLLLLLTRRLLIYTFTLRNIQAQRLQIYQLLVSRQTKSVG